ncbi:MAG: GNAT family N-acetyltransferase [Lachnospiraceae bacterium]|nr:GNAT family N-acetyltransferase [Lachnospiraceae bacterium]
MKIIKATDEHRLQLIEDLYMRAFPKAERKPFQLMVKKQAEGTMELLSIEKENQFLGLAIFAHDKDIALLDYFAISDEMRGQGIGSRAIKALQKIYAGKRFVLEIETTKKPCNDLEMRNKRKGFYLRNGLHTMDFDVMLFGVEMEMLSNADHLNFDEYLDVYKNACGLKYADKIHLIREVEQKNAEETPVNMSEHHSGITKNLVKTAFIKSLPVMAGYVVLAIGFGILMKEAGYGLFWSFLMSFTVYAGSMQFVAVSLLSSGASLISAALTTLMVNARHLFYGVSMIDKYKNAGKKKPYLIFALTDETYSLLCGDDYPEGEDKHWYSFFVSLFNQCYWVIGSIIGSILGSLITFNAAGIDFSMTALFVTVFVEQWLTSKNRLPALAGLFCSLACLVIFGPDGFLIPTMICITIVLSLCKNVMDVSGGVEND